MPKVGQILSLNKIEKELKTITEYVCSLSLDNQVDVLNLLRKRLHEVSPFKDEPIDLVVWIPTKNVRANDYNPNSVAPPEMKLLEHSIEHDGYTQPVVSWPQPDNQYEVVDGFHRTTIAKTSEVVKSRLKNYVPLVVIKTENTGKNDRIASTIRHNRARGKHKVEAMSDIVTELKKRNWSDTRIAKELGMDADEVLRLCQITGLCEVFSNEEFSEAWDVGIFGEEDLQILTEEDIKDGEEDGEESEDLKEGDG